MGRPRRAKRVPQKAAVVALLQQRGRFLVGVPFFPPAGKPEAGQRAKPEQHAVERSPMARAGRLVLLRPAMPGGKGRAQVVRELGRPDVARDVLEGLLLHRGLKRTFPRAVQAEAEEVRDRVRVETGPGRRDLRDLPTFTIDPATAQDFDDAISAREVDGVRRVWVHIADVSAYVRPGGKVDREAQARSTSTYVPGTVEPMLPEALSDDACSLRPHADRLAVTAELDFDGTDVVRATFFRSLVRSDARLDYDRVDRVFAGGEPAQEPWAAPLAVARAVAAGLQGRRDAEGALELSTSEPAFAFDRRGHVREQTEEVQTEAHRLIEHLMIAANEQVATVLADAGVPALHRIHERPDPASAKRLVAQLASLGLPVPAVPDRLDPAGAAEVIAACSHVVEQWVTEHGRGRRALTFLVLRSLKQARYDPSPKGHAGLGLQRYCHFTSPIRRYPDLVVHRALLALVGAGEDPPHRDEVEELGEHCSTREREAATIERDADRVVKAFVLERELFESGGGRETVHEGEITGMVAGGLFVTFGGTVISNGVARGGAPAHEGFVPLRHLRGDWWELNDEGTILHGTRGSGALRLGDPLPVRVVKVDPPRGRVDLEPAGPAPKGSHRAGATRE